MQPLVVFPECCVTGYWFIRNLSVGQLAALAETWKADDVMVIADLDASLLAEATGRLWIRARRPELYAPLMIRTGLECDSRTMKFEE